MKIENLKERIQHGDSVLPLKLYTQLNINHESMLYSHWHDEMEFFMLTEGKALFQVGNYYYELNAGEAIFINSDELHAGFSLDESICSYNALVFSSEFLCSNGFDVIQSNYISPLIKKEVSLPVHIKGRNDWEIDVLDKLKEIYRISTEKSYTYELIVKANLYHILSHMILSTTTTSFYKKVSPNDVERYKSVLEYIHDNYEKQITIDALSKVAHLSVGHFHRFFKRMSRKTAIEYINNYRINQASDLLVKSDDKIAAIAVTVGFDNISYFNSIFK